MRRMVIVCLLAGACARVPPSTPAPTHAVEAPSKPPSAAPVAVSCARLTAVPLPVRVGDARRGNAVALVRAGDRLLAYVADGDSRSIHTVDVDARRELVRTRVAGQPRQLLVLPDGRVAATLSDGTRLAVLEPAADPSSPMAARCDRELPAEPWGIAASPDDARVVVTSGWGATLALLDAATFRVERVVPLPRDPRSVLVDAAGVAFVSHAVGAKMSVVDLKSEDPPAAVDLSVRKASPVARAESAQAKRTGAQGYALASITLPGADGAPGPERVLEPMVTVDPGDPAVPSAAYYGPTFDGVPKEAPFVSAVNPARREAIGTHVLASDAGFTARECLLPRAAAVRTKSTSLLVACFGIDAVLELDALAVDPSRAERRRFDVPPGPDGIAVDDRTDRAVVFSQLAGSVSVVALGDKHPKPATIALDYHPAPALAAAARGRQLFYRTDDVRISVDGVACASCHIDGRDDAITWKTPMGPRQTPMLAGRLEGTQPYGWEGNRATLADYVGNTVTNLGGKGLQQVELVDLTAFLHTMPAPPSAAPVDIADRGRLLFEGPALGCAGCHRGGAGTDRSVHDLAASATPSGDAFDTPSLRFVAGSAPYFHDGRYPTLEALLADPADKMADTASLSDADRAALAAYLRTL